MRSEEKVSNGELLKVSKGELFKKQQYIHSSRVFFRESRDGERFLARRKRAAGEKHKQLQSHLENHLNTSLASFEHLF
jgi:hypothetical protein